MERNKSITSEWVRRRSPHLLWIPGSWQIVGCVFGLSSRVTTVVEICCLRSDYVRCNQNEKSFSNSTILLPFCHRGDLSVRKTVEALEGGQLLRVQPRSSMCHYFWLKSAWTCDTKNTGRRCNSQPYSRTWICCYWLLLDAILTSVLRLMLNVI
jgi:hypothetical protein